MRNRTTSRWVCDRADIRRESGAIKTGSSGGRNRGHRLLPAVLALEDRQLLSTFPVTSTADTLDSNNNPTVGTLRWAVEQADNATTPSTIDFELGLSQATITLDQLLTPIELSNTSDPITIEGPGASLLTIDGNQEGGIFQVDVEVSAVISGLTITGGSLGNGGAINDQGSLYLDDCTFNDNNTSAVYVNSILPQVTTINNITVTGGNSYFGAGVYVKGDATIENSTIDGNQGSVGTGICNTGITTVTNCTISGDKTVSGGGGGGIYNSGTMTISGCTLYSDYGGGAAVFNDAGTMTVSNSTISKGGGFIDGGNFDNQYKATLNLTDCTITGGVAQIGGGLYNAGYATVTDCTIEDGQATFSNGGGIANGPLQNKASLILTDSTISGNTAQEGGGGLFNNGYAAVDDCTFTGNDANQHTSLLSSNGGAIDNSGIVKVVACTITGNSTTASGGGVYDGGLGSDLATLSDTIIAGNFVDQTNAASDIVLGNNAILDDAYDAVGPGTIGNITNEGGNISVSSLASLGIEPVLGNYGGPTETMPLLPGSPAINAGSQEFEVGPRAPLSTDQRGLPLDTPNPDIGACQNQGFSISLLSGSGQSAASGSQFSEPLAVTVTAKDSDDPVAGALISYTVHAASNGATASLSSASATANALGVAEVTATAGSIGGPYTVTADYTGGTSAVTFDLANDVELTYGGLNNQSEPFGTTTLTISGTLASGSQTPVGSDVTVTLDGLSQQAPITSGTGGNKGAFSTQFNIASLGVADSPYTISYSFAAESYFLAASTTTQLTITPANPAIDWSAPGSITYGTPLSGTQLDATANVPGAFTYSPPLGTVLSAALNQVLSTTFTPTDDVDYSTVSASVDITITKATPTLNWATPQSITYGTKLSATQLDASASVAGTFVYSPASGTLLKSGTTELSVTFTPTDTTDYTTAMTTVPMIVNQAAPILTWTNPEAITYGTALSSTQLDATSSVPGVFTYTPASGTVLGAGSQSLLVDFVPHDIVDYSDATDSVTIMVNPASPTITWPQPTDISYGTALSATQLDATASVAVTFAYYPVAGTIPGAGTQNLSVTFTPTNSVDYSSVTATTSVDVEPASPTIIWANPQPIVYGTALSATQLDASSSVPGSYTYTPALGAVLSAGNGQNLTVTFTPNDSTDYTSVNVYATIDVEQAAPVITWADPTSISYGTALSTTQLDAVANIPGTFTYAPTFGAFPDGGTQTLHVSFDPTDATDYSTAVATTTIVVTKITPPISVSAPGGVYNGTPFPASVSLTGPGAAPSTSLDGIVPTRTYYAGPNTTGQDLGTTPPTAAGTYTVVASFPGDDNYNLASESMTFTISPATPVIQLSSSSTAAIYGQPVTLVATVTSSVGVPTGSVTFFADGSPLGTVSVNGSGQAELTTTEIPSGSQSIAASFISSANFGSAQSPNFASVQSSPLLEPVMSVPTSIAFTPGGAFKKKKLTMATLTARIVPRVSESAFPTGNVIFEIVTTKKKKTTTKILGTAALIRGAATISLSPSKVIKNTVTVIYSGDGNFQAGKLVTAKLTQKAF